jgi:hypothetical protein
MKKKLTQKTKVQQKGPQFLPRSESPRYHPATGQILSEVGGDSPYAVKKDIRKPPAKNRVVSR